MRGIDVRSLGLPALRSANIPVIQDHNIWLRIQIRKISYFVLHRFLSVQEAVRFSTRISSHSCNVFTHNRRRRSGHSFCGWQTCGYCSLYINHCVPFCLLPTALRVGWITCDPDLEHCNISQGRQPLDPQGDYLPSLSALPISTHFPSPRFFLKERHPFFQNRPSAENSLLGH
jgi:hypothetical protein